MENFCECDNNYKILEDMLSFLLKSYYQFIKIKGKDIKDKKSLKKFQNDYDALLSLVKSVSPKGNEIISIMQDCKNDHSQETITIIEKVEKSNEFEEKIKYHYDKIKKEIPNLEEIEEEEEENDDKNKINYQEILKYDKPIEEMTDKEIMERDKKSIILIQNLLEDEECKNKKKQDIKDLVKVKNQLKDIVNNIEIELNKNDEQIDNVETNLENGFVLIEKGNDENLKKAAQHALSRRKLEYQIGLASVLGLAGTIVPGIGNIIGAALGGLIGYGIYRIDKHRLNKIEKKYSEEKEDKNDKKGKKDKKKEDKKKKK